MQSIQVKKQENPCFVACNVFPLEQQRKPRSFLSSQTTGQPTTTESYMHHFVLFGILYKFAGEPNIVRTHPTCTVYRNSYLDIWN